MSKFMPSLRLVLMGSLFGAVLAACTPSSPQVSYYSLLGTTTQKVAERRNHQLILSVGPVTLPGVLKQSRIATGGTESRFKISENHRWTGEVDQEFSRALAEQLASRLGTGQVIIFPGDQHLEPNCQVLLDIVAMDGDLAKEAKLTVRWTLIDPKGKWAPISRRSHFSEHPTDAGYDAWVIAQQHNISQLSEEITILVKKQMQFDVVK